jgi:hypothetical protein
MHTAAAALAAAPLLQAPALAWDYEVHRLINQMALASLPTNSPAFLLAPAARERIAFLGGEPDRWRNTPDQALRHANGPDHFLDVEDLAKHGLAAATLNQFRYDFVAQLTLGRALHATNFPALDPARDIDHTRVLTGFLPWTITEYYGKLKSAFSYVKEFEAGGTAQEIDNARQNIVYVMGVMGHFVGDVAQPLHTTRHYNGWVGPNPRGYTTSRSFHAWIDSGFLRAVGVRTNDLLAALRPARRPWPESSSPNTNIFPQMLTFLLDQARLVEPLYQLEKDRKLAPGEPGAEAGRNFLAGQLVKAAQMLGDLWYSAWLEAPPDVFLRKELNQRLESK